jgi:hypothetical protein
MSALAPPVTADGDADDERSETATASTTAEASEDAPAAGAPVGDVTQDIANLEPMDRLRAYDWQPGLSAGVVTFVGGYLAVLLVIVLGPGSISGDPLGALQLVGIVFYSAHDVGAQVANLGYVNFLEFYAEPGPPEPGLPIGVYYGVPWLVLAAGGGLLASRTGGRDGNPIDGLAAALALAVGYAVAAVLGTYVVRPQSVYQAAATVPAPRAFVYAGLYALVFALIGASLVQFWRYYRAERA